MGPERKLDEWIRERFVEDIELSEGNRYILLLEKEIFLFRE